MPLGRRPGLEVLVEEREDVDLERYPGRRRRPLPSRHHPHEVPVVPPRILRRCPGLVVVSRRRPASLRDHHFHRLPSPRRRDRRPYRVHLRVEHVTVPKPGTGVHDPGVGLEERVVEVDPLRVRLVGEVGVGVDQEGRAGLGEEGQQRGHVREKLASERGGGGWVGDGEDGEGVGGGDGHLVVQAEGDEGGVEGLHCREKGSDQDRVVAGEHLVADGDGGDPGGGQVGLEVGFHPSEGGGGGDEAWYAPVGKADDDLHAGAGEGAEDGGVGVVKLDAGGSQGEEEGDDIRRRREVIGDLAVIHAD